MVGCVDALWLGQPEGGGGRNAVGVGWVILLCTCHMA